MELIHRTSAAPVHCPSSDALLADGNCMVLALSRLLDDDSALALLEANAAEHVHLNRSYEDLENLFDWQLGLSASLGCTITEEGDYLLHSDANGYPHCVAVRVQKEDDLHVCEVYDGPHMYQISLPQLQHAALQAVDGPSLVTFRVGGTGGTPIPNTDPWLEILLLELCAGGRSRGTERAAVRKRPSTDGILGPDRQRLVGRRTASVSPSARDRRPEKYPAGPDRQQALYQQTASAFSSSPKRQRLSRKTAGASSSHADIKGDNSLEPTLKLLGILEEEVTTYISELQPYARPNLVCRLCPQRGRPHPRMDRLIGHIRRDHISDKSFVPSGSKQLRLIMALYDHDLAAGITPQPTYIARSASMMASSAPAARTMKRTTKYDHYITLLLDADGPKYIDLSSVNKPPHYLRVARQSVSSKEFANMVFIQFVLTRGRLDATTRAIKDELQRRGCCTEGLLPTADHNWRGAWARMIELIAYSAPVQGLIDNCIESAYHRQEWKSISVDCTYKLLLRIKGQAAYRDGYDVRAAQPTPEDEQFDCILTTRGRTGLIPGMPLVVGQESNPKVIDGIKACLKEKYLAQLEHAATDDASNDLLLRFRAICRNIKIMSKDPMHLCYGFQRRHKPDKEHTKSFKANRILKGIARKFGMRLNVQDEPLSFIYDGTNCPPTTMEENGVLTSIAEEDADLEWAEAYLDDIDVNTPWPSRVEYMQAINAFMTVYWDECDKESGGSKISNQLRNAAHPASCEWLFNFTRYCASLPLAEYKTLASGTSSNEALHGELNTNFNTKRRRYVTTLELELRGFHIAKVLSHDRAATTPFIVQHKESDLLNRRVRHLVALTDEQWANGCTYYASLGSTNDRYAGHRQRSSELGLYTRATELAAENRRWRAMQLLKKPHVYWLKFGVPTVRCNKKVRLVTDTRKGLKGKKRTPFTAKCGTFKLFTKWGRKPSKEGLH